jgi:type VI secretion system secreted protein VgrG
VSEPFYTQDRRLLRIHTALGKDKLLLRSVHTYEEISRPFRFELELFSKDDDIKYGSIIGTNVSFLVQHLPETHSRYFNGFVTSFGHGRHVGRFTSYHATVRPWLWFLGLTSDCRIFQKMTAPDVIKKVLDESAVAEYEDKLTGSYQAKDWCVQYNETNLAFVSRIMETEGIYYYFLHENGKHTMVLADDKDAPKQCGRLNKIRYRPLPAKRAKTLISMDPKGNLAGVHQGEPDVITDWNGARELKTGKWALQDFNFETPNQSLLAETAGVAEGDNAEYQRYAYPGLHDTVDAGTARSKLAMEREEAAYEVVRGESTYTPLLPGGTFEMDEHPRRDANSKWLVTAIEHVAFEASYNFLPNDTGGERLPEPEQHYINRFTAIPASTVFRPRPVTPRPRIDGTQTALVVGPSGEEIHTDEHGRVRLHFWWDRRSKKDETSSPWVRVSQPWAGKAWGAVALPRIGQEVVVAFLEGDPDRPLVVGRVYNADQVPPYALPDNMTRTVIKSYSSKGGGGFNELRIEDKKGEEQIFVHAEKDYHIRVKNIRKELIAKDRHLIVQGKRFEKVTENRNLHVEADRVEKVDGDENVTVVGNRKEKIDGTVGVKIGGDRNHEITGDATTKVSGKQAVKVVGDAGLDVGGKRLEKTGGDAILKAGGNRNVKAGGDVTVQSGSAMNLKSGAAFAVDATGAIHIKSAAAIVIESTAQISLKVGGNFVDVGSGGVSIVGMPVNINSGGAAGAGAGCTVPAMLADPPPPVAPEAPEAVVDPEEPDNADPGQATEVTPDEVPLPKPKPRRKTRLEPVTWLDHEGGGSVPAAVALAQAASSGAPFCEECAQARGEPAPEQSESESDETTEALMR